MIDEMNADERTNEWKPINMPKKTFWSYITERRFSMLDFFLLMCMISIPSIVYGVISHLMGVNGY